MRDVAGKKSKRESVPKNKRAEKKAGEQKSQSNAAAANWTVSNMERQIEANKTGKNLSERAIEDTEEFDEYSPSTEEKNSNRVPKKIAQLSNDYGSLSIGMDREKAMTILAARKSHEDSHTPYEDSTRLKAESSSKIPGLSGKFLVNNIRPEASAAAYKESSGKSCLFMLERMKELVEKEAPEVMETAAAFLSTRAETEELEELHSMYRNMLEEGNHQEAAELGKRIEFLNRALSNKEAQKRQLTVKLSKAIEEIRSGRRGKSFSEGLNILRRFMLAADGEREEVDDEGNQVSEEDWSEDE